MLLNDLRRGESGKRRRKQLAAAGSLFVFYLIFKWSTEMFSVIIGSHGDALQLLNAAFAVVYAAFFIFLAMSGITVSIHYLFISSDLPLLMSAPLRPATIINFKMTETVIANTSLFFVLGIPVCSAVGVILHAPWYYYPIMLVTNIVYLMLPVSIAFLIAIVVVRMIPAHRAKDVVAVFLGMVSFGLWIGLQMVRASQFNIDSPDFQPGRINQLRSLMTDAIVTHLPSTWTSDVLVQVAAHHDYVLITRFIPLVCLTAVIWILSVLLARRLFANGVVESSQEVNLKTRRISGKPASLINLSQQSASIINVVAMRDVRLIFRDLRQLTNLMLLIVMMIAFPLVRGSSTIGDAEFMPFLFIVLFAPIVAAQIASRLIPMERKAFWMLLIAPQSTIRIWLGKLLVAFTGSLIATWLAVTVTIVFFHISLRISILAYVLTALVVTVSSVFGLTAGCWFAKFDWDHPKRMLTTMGMLITLYGPILMMIVWGGLIAAVYTIGDYLGFGTLTLDVMMILVSCVITAIVIIAGMLLGSRKLSRFEWQF